MSFEELGLDLKEFIDLHALKNVVLMGHSFGARNVWAYLQHHLPHAKKHVEGVIIVDILPEAISASSLTSDMLKKLVKIELK